MSIRFGAVIVTILSVSTCESFAPYYHCHLLSTRQSVKILSPIALSLSSTTFKGGNGKRAKSRNNNKGKKKGKRKGKPNRGRNLPVLIYQNEQQGLEANERRLRSKACDCDGCRATGCDVDEVVGNVDMLRSAARFFSSAAIRKNRIGAENFSEDWAVGDEEDGFYDVVVPTETEQWRTQSKLVAAPKSGSGGCMFGLYKRGTHEVIEMSDCRIHHPSINRAIKALTEATETAETPAYDGVGGLRYAQFQVERTTGKIALTLVWGASELRQTQPALSRLTAELFHVAPRLWHSTWCHCNDGAGNNIFSRNARDWHRLSGREFVQEPLPAGERGWLHFSPLAFRQGNMDGFDVIAGAVARAVPGGSRVCELYAGVGMLGLTSLVFHHQNHERHLNRGGGRDEPLTWVRCSDENPANPSCFSASVISLPRDITEQRAAGNELTTQGDLAKAIEAGRDDDQKRDAPRTGPKATYMVASAAEALAAGQALGADVLIVDPPRKGLEKKVLAELSKPFNPKQPCVEARDLLTVSEELVNWVNNVETLIYVSCGFDALARDCEQLLTSGGGWKLEKATGYILFPGSNHVETLCIFHRHTRLGEKVVATQHK